MKEDELQNICEKLKPAIGDTASALWIAYAAAQSLPDRIRAESIILLYAARHLQKQTINLIPPSAEESSGEFYLGDIYYGDRIVRPLFLTRENLQKHVAICGITGSGKTNAAKNLILEVIAENIPVMIIDWKRSFRGLSQLTSKPIKIFAVGRNTQNVLEWNPLRPPPGVHPKTWINIISDSLEKSHLSGLGSGSVFMEIFDELFERYGFYNKGMPDKYPNFYDAKESLENRKFTGRKMLWRDSCLRILRSFTFGPAARSFNSRNPVKIEDLLCEPVILEVDMELPHSLRVSFAEILLRWIHLHRLGQGESEKLRHLLVLEEAHNLFPQSKIERQAASHSIFTCCREIRSFGQGLMLIDQHPSLIPLEILGNINTQIFLSLSHHEDIFAARKSLFLEQGEETYLDNLRVGEGIVKIKGRTRPALVRFPLVEDNQEARKSA